MCLEVRKTGEQEHFQAGQHTCNMSRIIVAECLDEFNAASLRSLKRGERGVGAPGCERIFPGRKYFQAGQRRTC